MQSISTPKRSLFPRLAVLLAVLVATVCGSVVIGSSSAQAQSLMPPSAKYTVNPGDLIALSNGNMCTYAGTFQANSGAIKGATAGHCGTPGTAVFSMAAPFYKIGTIYKVDGADVASIALERNVLAGSPVSRTSAVVPGSTVCTSVQGNLIHQCGPVVSSKIPERFWVQTCSVSGMSGAPITDRSGRVVGILKGNVGGIPCVSPVAGIKVSAVLR